MARARIPNKGKQFPRPIWAHFRKAYHSWVFKLPNGTLYEVKDDEPMTKHQAEQHLAAELYVTGVMDYYDGYLDEDTLIVDHSGRNILPRMKARREAGLLEKHKVSPVVIKTPEELEKRRQAREKRPSRYVPAPPKVDPGARETRGGKPVKGYGYDTARNAWYAAITRNGRPLRRRFGTEEEAAKMYNWWRKRLAQGVSFEQLCEETPRKTGGTPRGQVRKPKPPKPKKLGYSYNPQMRYWMAYITIGGERRRKTFSTEEAARAQRAIWEQERVAWEREHGGSYRTLINFQRYLRGEDIGGRRPKKKEEEVSN